MVEGRQMNTPSRGNHDGGAWSPVPVSTVATWPVGSFAENLVVRLDGSVCIALYSANRIDCYNPGTGATHVFADLTAPPMGLAVDGNGMLWVTGGAFPVGPGHVWRVSPGGTVRHWTDLPDAPFINGCALHPDGRALLACESLTGRILAIDLREPDRWVTWVSDDTLKPDVPRVPGANGIKIKEGAALITVSGRQVLQRIPILSDGTAGHVETMYERLQGDDFAIGASGALYIATHTAQTVMRVDSSGARTTLAGPEQGAAGATACAFGRTPADATALYVTTTGGLLAPHNGVVEEAKLLRLEVGEAGWMPHRTA
jgi:sugar lactone lactonase YvrE